MPAQLRQVIPFQASIAPARDVAMQARMGRVVAFPDGRMRDRGIVTHPARVSPPRHGTAPGAEMDTPRDALRHGVLAGMLLGGCFLLRALLG